MGKIEYKKGKREKIEKGKKSNIEREKIEKGKKSIIEREKGKKSKKGKNRT
jgi:hypothetical protein